MSNRLADLMSRTAQPTLIEPTLRPLLPEPMSSMRPVQVMKHNYHDHLLPKSPSPYLNPSLIPQPTIIGVFLSNGIARHDQYRCHVLTCSGATFGRLADLKRHAASRHERNARFWCPVDGCERSMKIGGRSFPRKDKMMSHLESVHAARMGLTSAE